MPLPTLATGQLKTKKHFGNNSRKDWTMYVLRLAMILIGLLMLQSQPRSTTAAEVPLAPFSDLSQMDSSDCANGQCRMPKVAAVVEPVAKVAAVPVTKTTQFLKQQQPMRSALRRLIRR